MEQHAGEISSYFHLTAYKKHFGVDFCDDYPNILGGFPQSYQNVPVKNK